MPRTWACLVLCSASDSLLRCRTSLCPALRMLSYYLDLFTSWYLLLFHSTLIRETLILLRHRRISQEHHYCLYSNWLFGWWGSTACTGSALNCSGKGDGWERTLWWTWRRWALLLSLGPTGNLKCVQFVLRALLSILTPPCTFLLAQICLGSPDPVYLARFRECRVLRKFILNCECFDLKLDNLIFLGHLTASYLGLVCSWLWTKTSGWGWRLCSALVTCSHLRGWWAVWSPRRICLWCWWSGPEWLSDKCFRNLSIKYPLFWIQLATLYWSFARAGAWISLSSNWLTVCFQSGLSS